MRAPFQALRYAACNGLSDGLPAIESRGARANAGVNRAAGRRRCTGDGIGDRALNQGLQLAAVWQLPGDTGDDDAIDLQNPARAHGRTVS
jgi:hypothetical protein